MQQDIRLIEVQLHAQWLRALDGDSTAYTQVLMALSTLLRGFMRRRMQTHPNDVEDLVQETLMAIHQKRHTYDTQQPFTAWVFAIARYKWIDHLRVHGRRTPPNEDIDDWADLLGTDSGHSEAASLATIWTACWRICPRNNVWLLSTPACMARPSRKPRY